MLLGHCFVKLKNTSSVYYIVLEEIVAQYVCLKSFSQRCVQTGCVSPVLQSEAAGSLIAPWWLAAVKVINSALSM